MSDQPTTSEPKSPDPTTRCGGRRPSSCSGFPHQALALAKRALKNQAERYRVSAITENGALAKHLLIRDADSSNEAAAQIERFELDWCNGNIQNDEMTSPEPKPKNS